MVNLMNVVQKQRWLVTAFAFSSERSGQDDIFGLKTFTVTHVPAHTFSLLLPQWCWVNAFAVV